MSYWKNKPLGRIADELEAIESVDGAISYKNAVLSKLGGFDLAQIKGAYMSVDDWFSDYVRFIAERRTLPDIWYCLAPPRFAPPDIPTP